LLFAVPWSCRTRQRKLSPASAANFRDQVDFAVAPTLSLRAQRSNLAAEITAAPAAPRNDGLRLFCRPPHRLLLVDRGAQRRRRHRLVAHAHTDRVVDRVGNRFHRRQRSAPRRRHTACASNGHPNRVVFWFRVGEMRTRLRRATDEDAQAIAEVYFESFRLLTFLPMLHTAEGYRRFIANVILKECAVTVVEDDTGIVSFLALQGEEVRLLYTRPDRIGLGAGTQLIEATKSTGIVALELWCFQANARARRFYEARLSHRPLYRRCGERGADTRCPLSVGAPIKLGCPSRPGLTPFNALWRNHSRPTGALFVVFQASRSAPADFGDQVDFAVGAEQGEVGILVDLAVDRQHHAFVDLVAEAGERRSSSRIRGRTLFASTSSSVTRGLTAGRSSRSRRCRGSGQAQHRRDS
jgi:GNAT superfamily N-acetyltransferase